jgi:hypothetical protein
LEFTVEGPQILGYERAYARSYPKIWEFTTANPREPQFVGWRLEEIMIDILYLLMVVAFFAICIWMIDALEKLKEK